ncbi:MAG: hypothetical protein J4O10_11015 [Chloroflexi bacterium]|nr:hypothetical protein [Chloroflexota bacterium]
MAQRTTIAPEPEPEVENNAAATVAECRHHWVIQPADGPVSIGACQICGETREFKNYVESATWGDSRIASKNASASASVVSTSDDEDSDEGRESDEEEVGAEA